MIPFLLFLTLNCISQIFLCNFLTCHLFSMMVSLTFQALFKVMTHQVLKHLASALEKSVHQKLPYIKTRMSWHLWYVKLFLIEKFCKSRSSYCPSCIFVFIWESVNILCQIKSSKAAPPVKTIGKWKFSGGRDTRLWASTKENDKKEVFCWIYCTFSCIQTIVVNPSDGATMCYAILNGSTMAIGQAIEQEQPLKYLSQVKMQLREAGRGIRSRTSQSLILKFSLTTVTALNLPADISSEQIAKCICVNCKMYLFKLQNIFV